MNDDLYDDHCIDCGARTNGIFVRREIDGRAVTVGQCDQCWRKANLDQEPLRVHADVMMGQAWFGAKPWAQVCQWWPQIETPVGETCAFCRGPITESDEGVLLPAITSAGPGTVILHDDCFSYDATGSPWCNLATGDDQPNAVAKAAAAWAKQRHERYHQLIDGGMRPRAAVRRVRNEFGDRRQQHASLN